MSEIIPENTEEQSETEISVDASSEIRYLDPEVEPVVDDAAEPLEPVVSSSAPEAMSRSRSIGVVLPWWVMIIIGTAVAVGLHWILRWLGSGWFWSERLVYFLSLASLLLVVIGCSWLLGRQNAHALRVYIINVSIGLVSGVLISIMLFWQHVAFWTFFNLIVQPIDMVLLAALGSWLGVTLFINKT
jgi:hypothetical protein